MGLGWGGLGCCSRLLTEEGVVWVRTVDEDECIVDADWRGRSGLGGDVDAMTFDDAIPAGLLGAIVILLILFPPSTFFSTTVSQFKKLEFPFFFFGA